MRKTILLPLFCAALLTQTCHAGAAPESGSRALDVNVMSFNIRFANKHDGPNQWKNRKELAFDVIRRNRPDIIGLQEALRGQLNDIRKALPEYGEIGVGREGGKKGEYCAILYRTSRFEAVDRGTFWLSDTPEKPSSHWGNKCIRICTWARFRDRSSGQFFYAYNTHLDHESQPAREKGARLIMKRIRERKHRDPFLLTGDFNADERNPAITFLKGTAAVKDQGSIPLVDSFRVLHKDAKVSTINGFGSRKNGARIDYIFAAPGTRVVDASVVRDGKDGRFASDHFAVTARLGLVSAPQQGPH